jgi:dipeptidyl aminopeptidase/acylaminoacyl peptidase
MINMKVFYSLTVSFMNVRTGVLLILALLGIGLSVFAQKSDIFQPIDVFDLEYVSNPQISPDGKLIIYERNYFDIQTDQKYSNLWIVNTDGSENRPLTTGNQNDFNAIWSKDMKTIYYQSNADGKTQIYKMWLDKGSTAKISNTQRSQSGMVLSPDGKWIAFSMFVPAPGKTFAQMPAKPEGAKWNDPPVYIDDLVYRRDGSGYSKPGHSQIFMLSTDGGSSIQLTSSTHDVGGRLSWSADSKFIYFSGNIRDDAEYQPLNTELYILNIANGSIDALTDRFGPDGNPAISPDGKTIAYLGFDDKKQGYQVGRLYTYDIATKTSKLISGDFDNDVYEHHWAGDGKGLYFLYDENGNTKIGQITMAGKVTKKADNIGGTSLGRPYNSGSFSVSDNGVLAYTHATPSEPADLAVIDLKSKMSRLTFLNQDVFLNKKLGKVEEIWYESSFDKQKIQGWMITPPDFDPKKRYPLLLEIHGGPFANYGDRFTAELQLFAAAGYVVLYTNPRGSTSYGEKFGNLIHHDYPNHDYEDLMSGVDAVIAKGSIDESRLYVTGGSGGGVLTAWIVGKTDRFRAAVVVKPVINWYSFVLNADMSSFFADYWFPGKPWDHLEHYMKRSPISLVGNVTTPTMVMTGEEDYRTPISETEQYYKALKLQKVETAMVRIPNASHGIANRPSNLIAKVVYILKWFETYGK